MVGHAHFAWYELLTTDMAAARSFYGSVLGWTAQNAATSKSAYSIFNAGDAPDCGFMELPLGGGGGRLARRLQGFILPPL